MSEHPANLRNKIHRRVVLASVCLLAVLVASSLVFAVVEHVLEAVDRAH